MQINETYTYGKLVTWGATQLHTVSLVATYVTGKNANGNNSVNDADPKLGIIPLQDLNKY